MNRFFIFENFPFPKYDNDKSDQGYHMGASLPISSMQIIVIVHVGHILYPTLIRIDPLETEIY